MTNSTFRIYLQVNDDVLPPATALVVFFTLSVGILLVIKVLRVAIYSVFVHLLYPESLLIPFLSEILAPEIWILIWTLTQYIIMKLVISYPDKYNGFRKIGFLPPSLNHQHLSPTVYGTINVLLIFLILWAVRNACVKAVMLKLMLQFLTNFSGEIVSLFNKYSHMRKLNAAW